jgi:phosphocarrier protein HPr
MKQEVKIKNKLGIHARAAMKIIDLAGRFQSRIDICYGGNCIDAKDILSVMSLAVPCGDDVVLVIDGVDEALAMKSLLSLIDDLFGEAE